MAGVRVLGADQKESGLWGRDETLICRQLLAGHMVGSQQIKRRKNTSNDNINDLSLQFLEKFF